MKMSWNRMPSSVCLDGNAQREMRYSARTCSSEWEKRASKLSFLHYFCRENEDAVLTVCTLLFTASLNGALQCHQLEIVIWASSSNWFHPVWLLRTGARLEPPRQHNKPRTQPTVHYNMSYCADFSRISLSHLSRSFSWCPAGLDLSYWGHKLT